MIAGTIARLWTYPVKSLACESLQRVEILADGLAGDRTTALIVATPDHARAGKAYRGKENDQLHMLSSIAAAHASAGRAGVALDESPQARYFDAAPISILFDSWLHDVEVLAGRTLDPQRYRPNIFAHASAAFTLREAALVGSEFTIGSTRLRVGATIKRCITTTYDVATGEADPSVLALVARERANVVGVYCTVTHVGSIVLGDAIERA